jgi:hypothetical protein
MLLLGIAAAQAADVLAPPQWGSDQIRAARSIAAAPALVLSFARTTIAGKAAPVTASERVTLTASFSFVESPDGDLLDDHALCRVLTWKPSAGALHSDSCYPWVAFRIYEAANRRRLRELLQSATKASPESATKATPEFLQPYWDEAELGYQETPSDPLTRTAVPEGVDYRLGDVLAVRLRGPMTTVSADEMHEFVRYLADRIPLHPQVRRDLSRELQLPTTIEIAGFQAGQPYSQTITIKSAQRQTAEYPLPAGLTSDLVTSANASETPRRKGLRAALAVASGQNPAPPAATLVAAYGAEVKAGKPVNAFLDFVELTQLYGPWFQTDAGRALLTEGVKPTIQTVMADPGAAQFWRASSIAGGGSGDREAAAKYLAATNLDDLPFGTFRYVTFANLIRGAGDTSKWDPAIFRSMPRPEDGVWTHIARYPWGGNAYKDLGDTYFVTYDMSDAWLAYDLGRGVDGQWRAGPIKNLSDFEDRLRATQPDFF